MRVLAFVFCLMPALAGAQVLVAGSATPPETDISADEEQALLAEYWAVARRYRTDDFGPAVAEMTKWTRDRIGKVQAIQFQPEGRLPTTYESKAEWRAEVLRGAAMLHTDVALAAFRARAFDEFEFQTGIADGWLTLADNRRSTSGGFRARWNAAVVRLLVASGEWALAERRLERMMERIPNDAELILLAGTIRETQASRASVYGADGRLLEGEAAAATRRAALDAAAGLFARAIEADASLVEARIRQARVLTLQGRDAEAAPLLTAALGPGVEVSPSLKYVASMVLGGIRERAGDVAAAARLYVEAAQTEPDGQSAFLALAHVMYAVGQQGDAATVLERWFARGPVSGDGDPWWRYPLGLDADPEGRFDTLRAEARR